MAGGCGSCFTRGTRHTRSGLNLVIHQLPELNTDVQRPCHGDHVVYLVSFGQAGAEEDAPQVDVVGDVRPLVPAGSN